MIAIRNSGTAVPKTVSENTSLGFGHMSVVVRTARDEVLVAGDAMYLRRTLDDTHLPYRTEDEHVFRRSLREIRQYATETPGALIIPGHDWEAWQKLDAVY